MQQQQTYNLTEGKVSKLILKFFFPIFFTNMLQQIYNVADTVIVGKGLGDNALAAVGNMSSLTYFVIGFSNGLGVAFTSQNYGAGKYKRIREGLKVSLIIVTIAYVVLGAAMVLIPRTLAGFMLSGEKPISLVAEFMPICGYTLIFINFLFVYRSGCQAMGHPFVPMLSGVLEMVIRVLVIIFFVSEIGFVATAWSNTVAWFGALVLNFVAFEVNLRKKMRENVG